MKARGPWRVSLGFPFGGWRRPGGRDVLLDEGEEPSGYADPDPPVFPLNHAGARQSCASPDSPDGSAGRSSPDERPDPVMTERKRVPALPVTDRAGMCRAIAKGGEPCRKKAVRDGLCTVHAPGGQNMRAIGREGGRAVPKSKRREPDAERQTLRDYLREQAEPAKVWEAIQSGLASTNERDKLAAAKLLLAELYEPAAERSRVDEAEAARSRAVVMLRLDAIARRRVLEGLVEAGVIRAGAGQPFEGVVMFELRELAEWAGHWTPRPLEISDVACSTCGKAGVRMVKEGEAVDGGPVYCAACQPAGEAEPSSPAPADVPPVVPAVEEPAEDAWPRRSLA